MRGAVEFVSGGEGEKKKQTWEKKKGGFHQPS